MAQTTKGGKASFVCLAMKASAVTGERGILSPVPTKSFSKSYHVKTDRGFILLNGELTTKIEAVAKGDNWDVIFHLSDGSSHTVAANPWTKQFVAGILGGLAQEQESHD